VAQAARERYGPTLVLGDLNVTPWSPHFRALLREGRLADSARGFGWQASWPAYSLPLRIAIDHCLVSAEFTVLRRRLGPHVGSDHLPVFVEVGVK
jgi:endonuclease/exonuclease/phosphatase (EEP) superfamily protein YafD